jgi:hypothetical protein
MVAHRGKPIVCLGKKFFFILILQGPEVCHTTALRENNTPGHLQSPAKKRVLGV